jgi:hypothetical protein
VGKFVIVSAAAFLDLDKALLQRQEHILQLVALEEIVSKSTLLATRPSRLAAKNCINKSIWLATGGAPSMGTPRVPSGCQPN